MPTLSHAARHRATEEATRSQNRLVSVVPELQVVAHLAVSRSCALAELLLTAAEAGEAAILQELLSLVHVWQVHLHGVFSQNGPLPPARHFWQGVGQCVHIT